MSVIFTLRLFDEQAYRRLSPLFEALEERHADEAVSSALREALRRAASNEFRQRNGDAITASWSTRLQRALGAWESGSQAALTADQVTDFAAILIALLTMPGFVVYCGAVEQPPPENCFPLGDADGGLLLHLRAANSWFDELFVWNAALTYTRHPYGLSMAILTPDQLKEFRAALRATVHCNGSMIARHARLSRLVDRAHEMQGHTLALTSE